LKIHKNKEKEKDGKILSGDISDDLEDKISDKSD